MRSASDLGRPLPALLSPQFQARRLRFSDCLRTTRARLGGNQKTGGEECGFDDTRPHVVMSPNAQLETQGENRITEELTTLIKRKALETRVLFC